jgi:hemerythrin superfamily protein
VKKSTLLRCAAIVPRESLVAADRGGAVNGIDMLKDDHQRVDKLFKQFEEAGDQAHAAKRDLVEQIIEELTVHATAEEEVLYPTSQAEVTETEDIVHESEEEHGVVKTLISELEGMSAEDEKFDAKVKVLMENVRHHVEEEEGELLPRSEQLLGTDELPRLGEEMAVRKQQLGAG